MMLLLEEVTVHRKKRVSHPEKNPFDRRSQAGTWTGWKINCILSGSREPFSPFCTQRGQRAPPADAFAGPVEFPGEKENSPAAEAPTTKSAKFIAISADEGKRENPEKCRAFGCVGCYSVVCYS
jgi:hypothetical protein